MDAVKSEDSLLEKFALREVDYFLKCVKRNRQIVSKENFKGDREAFEYKGIIVHDSDMATLNSLREYMETILRTKKEDYSVIASPHVDWVNMCRIGFYCIDVDKLRNSLPAA